MKPKSLTGVKCSYTVEPLNADTFGTRPKCPVYRGVHISGVPRNVDTWGIGQNVQYYYSCFKQVAKVHKILKLSAASQPVAPDSEVSSFIRAIMPRNLAASGGRSSNPRERANQYQGSPSGIAVVKTAVMVGHSLHFFLQFLSRTFNKATVEVTGAVYGTSMPKAYRERLKKDCYRKQS